METALKQDTKGDQLAFLLGFIAVLLKLFRTTAPLNLELWQTGVEYGLFIRVSQTQKGRVGAEVYFYHHRFLNCKK